MQQSPHFFQTFRIVENCSQLTSQTETSNGMTHAGRGGEERGTALPASPSQAQLVEAGVPPPRHCSCRVCTKNRAGRTGSPTGGG